MRHFAACALLIALTACGSSEPGPGGVTANEAKALDEAAEMVESKRPDDSLLALPSPAAAASQQVAPTAAAK